MTTLSVKFVQRLFACCRKTGIVKKSVSLSRLSLYSSIQMDKVKFNNRPEISTEVPPHPKTLAPPTGANRPLSLGGRGEKRPSSPYAHLRGEGGCTILCMVSCVI